MKKSILIIAALFLSVQLQAQTLHALLFVNEKEPGREIDRKADMDNMKAFYKDVANLIGYSYNLLENSDTEFTATEAKREINDLTVGKDDIVVFYYSGHGYNEGEDKWPTLNFKDKDYWFSDILKELNQHKEKSKLLMCIADCCNKGYENASLPTASFNPISADNMKVLFTGFEGKKTILMSASEQGQYSWSDLRLGSLFGISLRSALYNQTDNSKLDPTWEKVSEEATKSTLEASLNKQKPQFQIIRAGNVFE